MTQSDGVSGSRRERVSGPEDLEHRSQSRHRRGLAFLGNSFSVPSSVSVLTPGTQRRQATALSDRKLKPSLDCLDEEFMD